MKPFEAMRLRGQAATNIQFITTGGTAANSTTLNFGLSSSVSNGDFMLFILFVSDHTVGITPPAGLTLVFSDNSSENGIYIWSKIASSEPSTYTFTAGSTVPMTAHIIAYRNASSIDVVGSLSRPGAVASVDAPGLNALTAGVLLAIFASEMATAGAVSSGPAGMTQRRLTTGNSRNMATYDQLPQGAGPTGNRNLTWTTAGGLKSAIQLQIK